MKYAAIAAVMLTLTACKTTKGTLYKPNLPATQLEAGSVTIAPYPVIPWEDISGSLAPNFSIKNADQVLPMVLPRSIISDSAVRSAVGFGVSANLGGISNSKSSVTNTVEDLATGNYDEATQTTNVERTLSTGEVSLPGIAPSVPAGTSATVAAFSPDFDASLTYRAAAALYQEIQLLNTYLSASVTDRNKVGYLFRVQITVQPFSRAQPLDVYSRLWVEVESCRRDRPNPDGKKSECVLKNDLDIIPILIAESGERSSSSRLIEAASQLEASLSGIVGTVGLGTEFAKIRTELEAVRGDQYNSLVNVAQSYRNELIIRFGGAYSPVSQYEMRPRTYDVSFLVVAPRGVDPATNLKSLNAETATVRILESSTFRNALTGKRLPLANAEYIKEFHKDLETRLNTWAVNPVMIKSVMKNIRSRKYDDALATCQSPSQDTKNCPKISNILPIFNLITDHTKALESNQMVVDLPKRRRFLPDPQTAYARDDIASGTTIRLTGAKDIEAWDDLTAVLVTHSLSGGILGNGKVKNHESVLTAQSISVSAPGVLELKFPSLAAMGANPSRENVKLILGFRDLYDNLDSKLAALDNLEKIRYVSTLERTKIELAKSREYELAFDIKKTAPPAQPQAFSVATLPVNPPVDDKGQAKFRLILSGKSKLTTPVPIRITLKSGTLESAVLLGSSLENPAKALAGSNTLTVRKELNRISGMLNNVYEVTLTGLTPSMDVRAEISLLTPAGKPNQAQSETIKFKTAKAPS